MGVHNHYFWMGGTGACVARNKRKENKKKKKDRGDPAQKNK